MKSACSESLTPCKVYGADASSHYVLRACIPNGRVDTELRETILQAVLNTVLVTGYSEGLMTIGDMVQVLASQGVVPSDPRVHTAANTPCKQVLDVLLGPGNYEEHDMASPESDIELEDTTFLVDFPFDLHLESVAHLVINRRGDWLVQLCWCLRDEVKRFLDSGQLFLTHGFRYNYRFFEPVRDLPRQPCVCGAAPYMKMYRGSAKADRIYLRSGEAACSHMILSVKSTKSDMCSSLLSAVTLTLHDGVVVTIPLHTPTRRRRLGPKTLEHHYMIDLSSFGPEVAPDGISLIRSVQFEKAPETPDDANVSVTICGIGEVTTSLWLQVIRKCNRVTPQHCKLQQESCIGESFQYPFLLSDE